MARSLRMELQALMESRRKRAKGTHLPNQVIRKVNLPKKAPALNQQGQTQKIKKEAHQRILVAVVPNRRHHLLSQKTPAEVVVVVVAVKAVVVVVVVHQANRVRTLVQEHRSNIKAINRHQRAVAVEASLLNRPRLQMSAPVVRLNINQAVLLRPRVVVQPSLTLSLHLLRNILRAVHLDTQASTDQVQLRIRSQALNLALKASPRSMLVVLAALTLLAPQVPLSHLDLPVPQKATSQNQAKTPCLVEQQAQIINSIKLRQLKQTPQPLVATIQQKQMLQLARMPQILARSRCRGQRRRSP